MALSLRQLLTPVTPAQVIAGVTDMLNGFGFQASAWQTLSANSIIIQTVAALISDATYAIVDIASSMHAGLASGAYADALGTYTFNLTRVPAAAAQGQMILTSSIAAPPHTFAANSLLIADSSADDANTYNVVTGGTLNPGTSMVVNVLAAVPGTRANVPPSLTTLELRTPLIGVSVTNPPNPPTTPVNSWLTTPGTDQETDGPGGHYNARMIGRWSRISPNNIEGAYRAWVLEALPAINRLKISEGAAEGAIHIVAATAAGAIDAGQITTVKNYLNGVTDGVGRRPINDVLEVVGATQLTTTDLNATITVRSPFAADAVARVTAAFTALLADPVLSPIGGKTLPGSSSGAVFIADLYAAAMAQQGVTNVDFPFQPFYLPLGPDQLWAPAITVAMVIAP